MSNNCEFSCNNCTMRTKKEFMDAMIYKVHYSLVNITDITVRPGKLVYWKRKQMLSRHWYSIKLSNSVNKDRNIILYNPREETDTLTEEISIQVIHEPKMDPLELDSQVVS